MNDPFDDFSKSLSEESVPRRESLRRLGAVFLGAMFGPLALGIETASANPDSRRRRRRIRKLIPRLPIGRPPEDACTGFCKKCGSKSRQNQCVLACRACGNDPKRMQGSCGAYACCGNGTTYCNGTCTYLSDDPSNCGACGNVCGESTPYCIHGTCADCTLGQTKCNGTCTDLYWDPANCGACGNTCSSPTPHCAYGTCGACTADFTLCNGTCVDTYFDRQNCGGCGIVCSDSSYCEWGLCIEV